WDADPLLPRSGVRTACEDRAACHRLDAARTKAVSGGGVRRMRPYPSRMHRRRWAIAVSITSVLMMATLAVGEAAGLRINATASMPRGLWRVQTGRPIERGEIVTVCPPDQADIREAAQRGYIPSGGCPGGYEPLVKPVAAI